MDSPFTSARGPITLAEHAAMITLRDCTAFRSWCGATTEAQAQARIYFDWPPPPQHGSDAHAPGVLSGQRPYAVIWTDDRGRGLRKRRDAAESWDASGVIVVQLIQDVPADIEQRPDEAFRRFKNTLGQILSYPSPNQGLEQLAGAAVDEDHCYLAIEAIDFHAPARASEDEAEGLGDYLLAQLTLHWGHK